MFLLYAINQNSFRHSFRYASDEVKLDANMDELPEIEEGLKELEQAAQIGGGRSGPYWSKIRAKILSCSSTQEVEEALKEWSRNGSAWISPNGVCQLCGHHPISFHFPIKNRVTGANLVVGSECIYNYLEIPGFGSMEELRRRLNGERNRLKKKEMGEISEEALAIFQEASELEAQLRQRFSQLAGGEPDFNYHDYRRTLTEVYRVIQGVNPKAAILAEISQAQQKCQGLSRIYHDLSKRSKLLKTPGLLAMVSAAMRVRDDALKLNFLKQLQTAVNEMLKSGYPSDFIKRCWETVNDEKSTILEKIDKSVDAQRERMKRYDSYLDKLKPYEFLHFSLIAGFIQARDRIEKEARAAKEFVMRDDFIDLIMTKDNPLSLVLAASSVDPMVRFDDQMIAQAVALTRITDILSYSDVPLLTRWIAGKFGIKNLRDGAGVRISCFRALDDSLVDFTDTSSVISGLVRLAESENSKFMEILQQEVDDIKALKKLDLWEFLSERWDFDVQKALKVFAKDGGFEENFCLSLVKYWAQWPKLTPKQMAIVQKKLAKREKELSDNMWDALKSKLTQPAPVG